MNQLLQLMDKIHEKEKASVIVFHGGPFDVSVLETSDGLTDIARRSQKTFEKALKELSTMLETRIRLPFDVPAKEF